MKNLLISLLIPIAALMIMFVAGGCYTQLGTARNDEYYDDDNDAPEVTQNTGNEEDYEGEYNEDDQSGYGEDWGTQSRSGFDYYYPNTYWPSVTFAVAYADPWGYGYGSGYGYGYGYGYYSPWSYYGYGYSHYHSPYYDYGYGYPYYPGYYYQNVAPIPRTNRSFGSTRASGGTRGSDPNGYTRGSAGSVGSDGSGMSPETRDLPAASGRVVTGGMSNGRSSGSGSPAVNTTGETTRSSGASRSTSTGSTTRTSKRGTNSTTRTSKDGTKSSTRDDRRIYRDRGAVSGSKTSSGKSPAVNGGTKSSTSTGSSRKSGTRSQSTPPARTTSPRPSPPPSVRSNPPSPSGGSGSQSSGTSRGGSTRNPRP